MDIAQTIFWISGGFVAYVYAGYPLLITGLSCLRRIPPRSTLADSQLPQVTVLMAAHNEAQRLPAKIANLHALDYPPDKLAILLVSDGSTDGSINSVQALPRVRAVGYPDRAGKARALNFAMPHVESEFVVFCDVRQQLEASSVRRLMENFRNPAVGAVSAELIHRPAGSATGRSIGLYWRYEKLIRKAESRFDSTVGASGALYAIRTRDFTPLPADTLLDDFEIPMQITRRGKRTVLESGAQVIDTLHEQLADERKRKIRTLAGNFQSFAHHPWLFSPRHNRLWFQFISHKVFRLIVPYALLSLLLASAVSPGILYKSALALQLLFYALAGLGYVSDSAGANRLVSFARTFVDMNSAAVIALLRFLSGRVNARWEKT